MELHFPYITLLNALKHKCCLSLGLCHKHNMQFTEPTPTIYWHAKRNKNLFKYASTNPIKTVFLYLKRNV